MRLELGTPVTCADGLVGELADVVVDPRRRRVTHLVVAPRHDHHQARLAAIELARPDEATAGVTLRCTAAELQSLPRVEEFEYPRLNDVPLDDPDWDVGIETVLALPHDDIGLGAGVMDFDPHVSIVYDRVPHGDVEIRRASDVFSADEHRLGHVKAFVVDGNRITHLVLEHGHLFGRRDVTIPVESIEQISNDRVTLELTKDEVAKLPAIRV